MKTKIILVSILLISGTIFAKNIKDPTIIKEKTSKEMVIKVKEKNYDYLKFDVNKFYQPTKVEYIETSKDYEYLKFDVNKYYSTSDSINELPK